MICSRYVFFLWKNEWMKIIIADIMHAVDYETAWP